MERSLQAELVYERNGALSVDYLPTVEEAEERAREYLRGSGAVTLLRIVDDGVEVRDRTQLLALAGDLGWTRRQGLP